MKPLSLIIFSCLCSILFKPSDPLHHIEEASGVCTTKDHILISYESSNGSYIKIKKKDFKVPYSYPLDNYKDLERDAVQLSTFPLDIESIEARSDGSIIFLSELTRTALSSSGIEIDLPDEFSEIGKRGVEGIALKPFKNVKNVYESVVVWEGGLLDTTVLNEDFIDPLYKSKAPKDQRKSEKTDEHSKKKEPDHQRAYYPKIRIDTLPINDLEKSKKSKKTQSLNLKDLNDWVDLAYPESQRNQIRFRATDLVWYKDEIIVLLSGGQKDSDSTYRFYPKVLQKFNRNGDPTSKPYDLKAHGSTMCQDLNWEGMDWYVENESLVFVNDAKGDDQTQLVFLEMPKKLR